MEFKVRPAEARDMQHMHAVLRSWMHADGSDDDATTSLFISEIEASVKGVNNSTYLVLVTKDDAPQGLLGYSATFSEQVRQYASTNNPVTILLLMISKSISGQGAGAELLSIFEEQAKEDSFTEIVLTSAEKWKDSWDFYRRQGYEDRGELPNNKGRHTRVFSKILDTKV